MAFKSAMAGTGAAVVAMTLLYPLDTIRTRLQLDKTSGGHKSLFSVLMDVRKSKDGFAQLYRGLQTTLTTIGISQAVYFWWYTYLKNLVMAQSTSGGMSVGQNLVIAYVAGAINAVATCPLWTVTTRIKIADRKARKAAAAAAAAGSGADADADAAAAVSEGGDAEEGAEADEIVTYTGTVDALVKVAKAEGVPALFHSVPPALLLCSNPAIVFLVYERVKTRLLAAKPAGATLSAAQAFFLGAFAKSVATVLTYPLQVVQARQQSSAAEGRTSLVRDIYENEGIGGFFKGLQSKIVQTVLNSAIVFLLYESFLETVNKIM